MITGEDFYNLRKKKLIPLGEKDRHWDFLGDKRRRFLT
jgi:hypothetical protein